MGRWFAGALMVALVVGCTPAGPVTTAPGPQPTTSAPAIPPATTPAESPTPSDTASAPECDFLPRGVDPRACGVPEAAQTPIPASTEFPDLYMLSADDGRIRCDVSFVAEFGACAIRSQLATVVPVEECDAGDWDSNFVYLWKPDGTTWAAGQGSCRSDPLTAEIAEPPALPEGSVLVDGDLAVLATADGIVVWDGVARHGFAIVEDRVLTW